jgi:hypothetical protein
MPVAARMPGSVTIGRLGRQEAAMPVKISISLTDDQEAYARGLVDRGQ